MGNGGRGRRWRSPINGMDISPCLTTAQPFTADTSGMDVLQGVRIFSKCVLSYFVYLIDLDVQLLQIQIYYSNASQPFHCVFLLPSLTIHFQLAG
jgi:hypothetical protein